MEVAERETLTEDYSDIGGLDKEIEELIEGKLLDIKRTRDELFEGVLLLLPSQSGKLLQKLLLVTDGQSVQQCFNARFSFSRVFISGSGLRSH